MEGLTLSISALDDGNRSTNVGPFTNRARVVFISNGSTKTGNHLDEEDGYLTASSRREKTKVHILNLAKKIGNANPIVCIPVGKEPDVCLLGGVAYGSKGGKLLHHKEAKQYARYTLNMLVAGEIMGRIPPSEYTIDDIKTAVIDGRKQHDFKEKDLEDVFEILKNRHAYDMNVYPDEESMEECEYRGRDSRLPPPGTRVRRGPNWHYNDQDSNGPGTIIGHWTRDAWVYVEWDTGMKFPYEYDTENVDSGDIVITMNLGYYKEKILQLDVLFREVLIGNGKTKMVVLEILGRCIESRKTLSMYDGKMEIKAITDLVIMAKQMLSFVIHLTKAW
ncbi:uncharacterized protein LOC134257807 [Saccostrea cucullata]|uniref:uncharacterized protein LOC134257807 n=1 Tax=Saccostrea cuccullata TaxID=36930 RepID=UPI002ED431EE